MRQNTELFIDLPPDILFRVFSECDVVDVLRLSSTCKWLKQMTDEHQVWLHQAENLQIPVPPGTTPSKAELKSWTISCAMVEFLWIKRRPGDLTLCSFETDTDFVDAHLIPGGEFVVLLYFNGDVGLNRIERSVVTGELAVREVTRYRETNMNNRPNYWSGLLTETSYGCPVLVLVQSTHWGDPSVFLIDPVSQVIQRKQPIHRDFEDDAYLWEILAIKDRVFFIYEGSEEILRITVVSEPGPKSVTKHFNLSLPWNYDAPEMRFFVVSKYGLIVTNNLGIWLYHVPELRAVENDTTLFPVWDWSGDSVSKCRGTLYKTESPYPALWLQGDQATHTLEFDVDESGFPVVVDHHRSMGRPAYCEGKYLKLRGRKGIGIGVERRGEVVLNTGVLGRPDITRRLRAPIPGLNSDDRPRRPRDVVKFTDLDEATGRIMIAVGPKLRALGMMPVRVSSGVEAPHARRLYIGDLPI